MHHPFRSVVAATFALVPFATARAQTPPPLWTAIAQPPAAAIAWETAERGKSPMVAQSSFVHVDHAALQALPPGGAPPLGTFRLDLPTGPVTLVLTGTDWTLGYRTFRGHVPNTVSTMVLTVAPTGEVHGLFDIGDAQFALVPTPAAGVHVVQSLDASQLPAHMGCGTNHTHLVAPAPVAAPPSLVTVGNSDCSLTTIDICVFYTPNARNGAGGTAAVEVAILGAITQANEGHRESGAPIEFRLVHMAETTYTEVGSSTDLSRFRSSTDGFMDEVHGLRNDHGADLMHLVIEPPAGFCGVGYLLGSLSTGFESSAFAVTVRTCIPNRTLTHECGHNIGCHHDLANAGAAIYPYSYGYRTPDNAYRTIMAYAPGTRVNRWSSPNVVYQGYTMGTAGSADNVLSITNTSGTVTQFRTTQAPRWCQLGGGIAGASGTPSLVGTGTINQVAPLELSVAGYGAPGIGALILGVSAVNVPLFGGTLVPALDYTVTLVGSGAPIVHDASWLVALPPGFQIWAQAAFLDLTGPQGWTASDAVRVTRP
jgi:hypothetical protein